MAPSRTDDSGKAAHGATPWTLGIGRLFEHSLDAVVVSDLNGRILLWNPAAERIFGYTAEQALGQLVDMIVPQRLRQRHRAGMERFQRTGRGAIIDADAPLELPAVRRDGSEVMVELTLSEVDGEDGSVYVMAIVRDVSDRVRLQHALEQERNALRNANESLEAFTYVVGHDLKEPVRGIGALLEELREEVHTHEAIELVESARVANRRMARMLMGLLEWSRTAMAPLEAVAVDVGAVVRGSDCGIYYGKLTEERGARVEVAERMPLVRASPNLLCQVMGNLLTNAIRHNAQREPWVRVAEGRSDDDWVEVVVEDNGAGFPQHVIDRVHRLQNKPSTVQGGFGLAIARRAVERLGGAMTLENRDAGGARVRVRLPRAVD